MALQNIQNTSQQRRRPRFIRSKFSIEPNAPIILKDEDDFKNYENNKFIDSIFEEDSSKKPIFIEKVVSFSKLNTSSITITKLIRVEEIEEIKDKENIPKRVTKRACVEKTIKKIKQQSSFLNEDKSAVYVFNNDDVSDGELIEMVNRSKSVPKPDKKPRTTTRTSRAKQREMERIREQEEREIRDAAREYQQIKNYELIVETVEKDY